MSESRDLNQVRKERHCLETNMMMIFNLSSPQNTFLKKEPYHVEKVVNTQVHAYRDGKKKVKNVEKYKILKLV